MSELTGHKHIGSIGGIIQAHLNAAHIQCMRNNARMIAPETSVGVASGQRVVVVGRIDGGDVRELMRVVWLGASDSHHLLNCDIITRCKKTISTYRSE